LVNVPLMIRDPNNHFSRGMIRQDIISTRCLFHTVLAAAGLASEVEEVFTLAQKPDTESHRNQVFAEAIPPQNVINLLQKRHPELIETRACNQLRRAIWMGNHKLIETGSSRLELYDVFNDPLEQLNLSEIFPENVELLQDCLHLFAGQTQSITESDRAPEFDDPEVQQRLRDLGYLE
jgi:arylsulfatase A-like enzyme